MAKKETAKKTVSEVMASIKQVSDEIIEAKKILSDLWDLHTEIVLSEMKELGPILKGEFPDWDIIFKGLEIILRSEKAEVHIIWSDSVRQPIYQIGMFSKSDKTQCEFSLEPDLDKLKEWVQNEMPKEIESL